MSRPNKGCLQLITRYSTEQQSRMQITYVGHGKHELVRHALADIINIRDFRAWHVPQIVSITKIMVGRYQVSTSARNMFFTFLEDAINHVEVNLFDVVKRAVTEVP